MALRKGRKEFNYFEGFCEVGKIASEAADYLKKTMKTFDAEKIHTYADAMHKFENDADAQRHELCSNLAHEFMPPIEREDISLLSQELDNIVDSVEDVMRKMYMFNIREIRSEAIEFAELASEICEVFYKLLKEFPNFKKSKTIRDYIIEINTLENKGDKLHAKSIRRLFKEVISPSDQLGWTMIFESLEKSIDACEGAADIIDGIITKNT
jgi:predicted phosphate transport protein (TIGR00153 family)